VKFRLRERGAKLLDESEEVIAKECGLTARDGEIFRGRGHQPDKFLVASRQHFHVVFVFGRLGTHQAVTAASLRDKERVMLFIRPVKRADESIGSLQHDHITVPEMIRFAQPVNDRCVGRKIVV
jgi:hypothetical protein